MITRTTVLDSIMLCVGVVLAVLVLLAFFLFFAVVFLSLLFL